MPKPRLAIFFFCFTLAGIAISPFGAKVGLVHKAQAALTYVQTAHYGSYDGSTLNTMKQNYWGDFICNQTDADGTSGGWGIAPDNMSGWWPTNLTQSDYKIEIGYHGNPKCCGDQSFSDSIWVGGNNADVGTIDFVYQYGRSLWNGEELTRTTDQKGVWHTLTITKTGNAAVIQLTRVSDGALLGTWVRSARSGFPTKLIMGGQCWTGCEAPGQGSLCLYGDWNNFLYNITFYDGVTACSPNTTTAYVGPTSSGPWYANPNSFSVSLNQAVWAKGDNSAGQLSSLGESPGNWAQNPALDKTAYQITKPESLALGNHTVTAVGGGGGYCSSTSLATTYICNAVGPSVSVTAPSVEVSTTPITYTWSTSNFGTDSCGANSTTDDTTTVTLCSDSGCTAGHVLSTPCTYTGLDASTKTSCAETYNGWTAGATYWWKLTANNGKATTSTTTSFTYNPKAGPWWQTDSGFVYSQGSITSLVPNLCVGPSCRFNTQSSGYPGVVTNGGDPIDPTASFNGVANISSTKWLANSPFLLGEPSYADFRRQVPVAPEQFNSQLNNGFLQSHFSHGPPPSGADAYYFEYTGNSLEIVGNVDAQDQKIVVFVPSGTVTIKGDIVGTRGKGFFALVAVAPIVISPTPTQITGLFLTDSTLTTQSAATQTTFDTQLKVTGIVFAKGGITLNRDLDTKPTRTTGGNNTTPAELFSFAPDYLFTLPRALRRFQFQLSEVPPTD